MSSLQPKASVVEARAPLTLVVDEGRGTLDLLRVHPADDAGRFCSKEDVVLENIVVCLVVLQIGTWWSLISHKRHLAAHDRHLRAHDRELGE